MPSSSGWFAYSATCVANSDCRASLSLPLSDAVAHEALLVAVVDDRLAARQVHQRVRELGALLRVWSASLTK